MVVDPSHSAAMVSAARLFVCALSHVHAIQGCCDTVKKPKLLQHYGQCHSSFSCIDCSATFHTPAEFSKHTSCVSEAEKYQKKLYKGPKHVRFCFILQTGRS
jgi:hypothetical protein